MTTMATDKCHETWSCPLLKKGRHSRVRAKRFKLINMVKKVLPRFFGKTRQSDFPGCYTPLNEDDLPFVLFLIQTGFMFVVKVILLPQQETVCEILVSVRDTMVLALHTKEV